jgi:small-conductance mechanosensitive channel
MLDIQAILTEMWNSTSIVILNVLKAILFFSIGYIISKLVAKGLEKTLQKLKIDQLGDKLNEIELVSKANADIKLSKVFSKAIYYFLLLFFMVAAAEILNMPVISDVFKGIFNFFPKALTALLIIILGLLFAEFMRKILETAMKSLGISSATLISNFIFYFLFVNIFIVALAQAEINTDFLSQNLSLIIGGLVAAFAIAYGLASKDVVANYVASFYATNHIEIGDRITVDEINGVVSNIDKATVEIQTESSKVLIPLSKFINQNIEIHR